MKYVLVSALLLSDPARQDPDSIIEMAKRHGGKANLVIGVLDPVGSLDVLVAESALVVRAIVHSASTALSHDQRIVVTELELVPLKFYRGGTGFAEKPGQVNRPIARRPGGHLMFEGLDLRTTIDNFPETQSAMSAGDEVILFLAPNEGEPGKYRIHRRPFGAFRVTAGKVIALTTAAASRREDPAWTVEAFEQEIGALMRR